MSGLCKMVLVCWAMVKWTDKQSPSIIVQWSILTRGIDIIKLQYTIIHGYCWMAITHQYHTTNFLRLIYSILLRPVLLRNRENQRIYAVLTLTQYFQWWQWDVSQHTTVMLKYTFIVQRIWYIGRENNYFYIKQGWKFCHFDISKLKLWTYENEGSAALLAVKFQFINLYLVSQ